MNLAVTAIFFRQFATLMQAGIPIDSCCDILAKNQQKPAMSALIVAIKHDLANGHHLSDCLRRHANYFDHLTCQLIHIGEETGKLETMLLSTANYHENTLLFKKNLYQALFYPCVITATALIIFLAMLIFIIPKFSELFQDSHVPLPYLTLFIFRLSALLRTHGWLILLALTLSAFLFKNHFPAIYKPYSRKNNLSRFSRHLALTISAGIPIIQALSIVNVSTSEPYFRHLVLQLQRKINSGLSLYQAMSNEPLFPHLLIQLVKIGEESGQLEAMLSKFADLSEADMSAFLKKLNQLLEPLIMLVLGVLIGGLVIGMYLPVFKLGSTI